MEEKSPPEADPVHRDFRAIEEDLALRGRAFGFGAGNDPRGGGFRAGPFSEPPPPPPPPGEEASTNGAFDGARERGQEGGRFAEQPEAWDAAEDIVADDERQTAAVRRILAQARDLAGSHRHREVLIAHFMLAMSMEPEARKALERRGVDVNRFYAAWYERLRQDPLPGPRQEPPISAAVRRLFARAERYARTREPELQRVAVVDILSELSHAPGDYDEMLARDFSRAAFASHGASGEPSREQGAAAAEALQEIGARLAAIESSLAQPPRYDHETARRFERIFQDLERLMKAQERLEALVRQPPPPPPPPEPAPQAETAGGWRPRIFR